MTLLTKDEVKLAASHEVRLERQEIRPQSWWRAPWSTWKKRLLEGFVTLVLWGGLLMIASPLGQLLSAIWDTVKELSR